MLETPQFLGKEGRIRNAVDPETEFSERLQHSSSQISSSIAPRSVDRVLFKDLVEMVPLIESLMDRRETTSFTRRASHTFTPTPAKQLNTSKADANGCKTQKLPSKKQIGCCEQHPSRKGNHCDLGVQKDVNLAMLQKEVADLKKQLAEKDELLKCAQESVNQMQLEFNELKRQMTEKDMQLNLAQMQHTDAKIKLADKQALLEKLQWEVSTSNSKFEELEQDLCSLRNEDSLIVHAIEMLAITTSDNSRCKSQECPNFSHMEVIQEPELGDAAELQMVEAARESYAAAVAYAKENPCEETLALAADARFKLRSFLLEPWTTITHMTSKHLIF